MPPECPWKVVPGMFLWMEAPCWRDYVPQLVWGHFGVPLAELEDISMEKEVLGIYGLTAVHGLS